MAVRSTIHHSDTDDTIDAELLDTLAEALGQDRGTLTLVGDDVSVALPPALVGLLRDAIEYLQAGDAVRVTPDRYDLSTRQAAGVLNVPYDHFETLLDDGEIPFELIGGERRVPIRRLVIYKAMRDSQLRSGLAELTRLSQELGLYDIPPRPRDVDQTSEHR